MAHEPSLSHNVTKFSTLCYARGNCEMIRHCVEIFVGIPKRLLQIWRFKMAI